MIDNQALSIKLLGIDDVDIISVIVLIHTTANFLAFFLVTLFIAIVGSERYIDFGSLVDTNYGVIFPSKFFIHLISLSH